jgi:multidrug efflux pump subunit AcrA (membrane-fusion protein)
VTTAAALAPVAVTGSASGATTSTATLSGTVNPESNDTTYYFEYGPTKTFGSTTATIDAGAGASASQVSALLTGLRPGTTYAYDLVASNAFGIARGVSGFFTTSTATSASTGAASNVTTRGATLNGTVDPQGANTTYYFEYGLSGKLAERTPTESAGAGNGSVSVSVAVTSLEPGKTYTFRLVARNLVGESAGAKETLTTAGASKPTVAAGSASGVGISSATLTGTVNPSSDDTTYYFEYGTTSSYGSRTKKVDLGSGSSPAEVSAVVDGLRADTTYLFRLVATNGSGTAFGAEATFATAAAPGKPTATTGSASSVLATSATLTGSVDANGTDTKYYFEYSRTASSDKKTAAADAGSAQGAAEVTTTVEGLAPDTSYLFKLVATNRYGTTTGLTQIVTTAQRSCVTDSSNVSTDDLTVSQQEASVQSAELSLQQTQATITSSATPDAATIAQDEAAIAQDKATVAADQTALDETTLRAPVSGTVTAVSGTVGETVGGSGSSVTTGASSSAASGSGSGTGAGAGTGSGNSSTTSSALVTIDSLDKLEVVSGFAEADATKITLGQPATITFPALPNVEVAGKVTAVSSTSTVVSDVVTYNETITLVNPPPEVKEGMTANVSVVTETRSNVLELPSSAITTNGNASTVELLQNGKTTVTPVTTGLVGASTTEIVRGLQKGDVVVEPTVSVTAATSATGGTGVGGAGGFFGGGGGGGGTGLGAVLRGGGG